MGRFETAADFYHFREPYPTRFFESVSARLQLTQSTRMLDVGCGPGNLAIGFAPLVGPATAIDVEPDMLRVARTAAADARVSIVFQQTRVEDLTAAAGSFDFVTIGRALHWLSPAETLAVLERVVAPGGRIAICRSSPASAPANAWHEKFRQLRRTWSSDPDESRYRPDLTRWFAASRFRQVDEISAVETHTIAIPDLVGRGLSFSVTSPAVLGERRAQFEKAIEDAMKPLAKDGLIEEELLATATVFA